MPAYLYKCDSCDVTVTIVRGINSDEAKPVCVKCGEPMQRDYGVNAVTFKGNGWGAQA